MTAEGDYFIDRINTKKKKKKAERAIDWLDIWSNMVMETVVECRHSKNTYKYITANKSISLFMVYCGKNYGFAMMKMCQKLMNHKEI